MDQLKSMESITASVNYQITAPQYNVMMQNIEKISTDVDSAARKVFAHILLQLRNPHPQCTRLSLKIQMVEQNVMGSVVDLILIYLRDNQIISLVGNFPICLKRDAIEHLLFLNQTFEDFMEEPI